MVKRKRIAIIDVDQLKQAVRELSALRAQAVLSSICFLKSDQKVANLSHIRLKGRCQMSKSCTDIPEQHKRKIMAEKLTVQTLMKRAVGRRDELNVFIGVLQELLAEEAQQAAVCQAEATTRSK